VKHILAEVLEKRQSAKYKPRIGKNMREILNDIKISDIVSSVPILPSVLSAEEPLITIAFLLSVAKKSNALVKDAGGTLIGEVGTVELFNAFYPDYIEIWKRLYTIKLKDVARKIKFLIPEFPLGTYYYKLKDSKYSDAVVISNEKPISFITPYSLLKYYFLKSKIPDLKIDQIQSNLISVESNVTVREISRLMIEKWIRRVVIKGKVVDDRSLLEHGIFNMNYLSTLAKEPDTLLNMQVESIEGLLKDPDTYSKKDSIYEISKKVLNSEIGCAVSEDYKYIITPYDIAVKPYIQPYQLYV